MKIVAYFGNARVEEVCDVGPHRNQRLLRLAKDGANKVICYNNKGRITFEWTNKHGRIV